MFFEHHLVHIICVNLNRNCSDVDMELQTRLVVTTEQPVLGQIPCVKYLNTFKYFQILNLVQVPGTYFSGSFRTNNSSVLQHQSHNRIKTAAPIDTIIISIPKEWPDFINF